MSARVNGSNPVSLRIIAPQKNDLNKRLDKFLSETLRDKSRSQIQRMIERQEILVNGKPAKSSYTLRGDEQIRVSELEKTQSELVAEPIPLQIVYEDTDLGVVNKPAGMIVHSGAGAVSGTMVNALLYHFRELSKFAGTGRPGIVHRLDKHTSGLIIVAKNDISHQRLSRQFQSREVLKKYLALVHGTVKEGCGEISSPIGRDRVHRVRMTTRGVHAREAYTRYETLKEFQGFTLLQLTIKTGRTHQIRVHLSSIKHPVVGDTLYGAPSRIVRAGTRDYLPSLHRYFLHAAVLEFVHPRTQEPLKFRSDLPEELKTFLQHLSVGDCAEGLTEFLARPIIPPS
jgi:23S rRNA pseudouridine1911/1915/1917 synthase